MSRKRAISLLLFLGAGCRTGGDGGKEAPEENAIVQARERGPVKVTLRVEPREPTFADRVRFTIEAFAPPGVALTLPAPGENLGGFFIKDYDAPPEYTTADGSRHRRSYVLEFFTSGEYKIPSMTISFRDPRRDLKAAGGGGEALEPAPQPEFKIVTDEITLQVKPLPDPASLKELAPIAPPAEPPPLPGSLRWPLGIGGGVAALALLAFAAAKLLRRRSPPPPPLPPHERAYSELEWLLEQGFIDRGELKEFFFHLSRILREYIEGRFGLRAPELTTEEFLEAISNAGSRQRARPGGSGGIPSEHQGLLREFLERADLVKFARYHPARDEIESSFEASKRFIGWSPAAGPVPESALGAPRRR